MAYTLWRAGRRGAYGLSEVYSDYFPLSAVVGMLQSVCSDYFPLSAVAHINNEYTAIVGPSHGLRLSAFGSRLPTCQERNCHRAASDRRMECLNAKRRALLELVRYGK